MKELNKIIVEIKTFDNFLNPLTLMLLYLKPFDCTLPDLEFHFHKDAYDMLHVYTTFHQMDDTTLQCECDIVHA